MGNALRIFFILSLVLCVFTSLGTQEAEVHASSSNISIATSQDDGHQYRITNGAYFDRNNIYVRSSTDPMQLYWAAFRFVVSIPQGSAINSVVFGARTWSSSYDDANCRAYFQKAPSPAPLSSAAGDITKRPLTTASVPWIANNLTPVTGSWIQSHDLGVVLQEVVSEYDIDSVALILVPNTDANKTLLVTSWDYSNQIFKPWLYIDWTPPEGGTPEPPTSTPTSAADFQPSAINAGSISLSWTPTSDNCSYEVRYSPRNEFSSNVSGALGYFGTDTNCTITNLSPDTDWHFSLFTHRYDNGEWQDADSFIIISTHTSTCIYPEYAPYGDSPQIVYIGDSIISAFPGNMLEESVKSLAGYTYLNKGVGGETTTNISVRFDTDVLSHTPRIVVIYGGTIDISIGYSKEDFLSAWTSMLDKAQTSNISLIVVLKIIPRTFPSYYGNHYGLIYDEWNLALKNLTAKYSKTVFVDADPYLGVFRPGGPANNLWDMFNLYSEDGCHPNAEGYLMLAQAVLNCIVAGEVLAELSPPGNPTLTDLGAISVQISWEKAQGATYTMVRASRSHYPSDIDDGELMYFGEGDEVKMSGFSLDTNTYYFSFWSFQSDGVTHSPNFAQNYIGTMYTF